MRPRHIDERAVALLHIGQKQPGLHGGMKRVGMQLHLRIVRCLADSSHDRLQVVHGMASERTGIAEQPQPLFAPKDRSGRRHVPKRIHVQRDATGDRVALHHLPAAAIQVEDLLRNSFKYRWS
ncbi:hypothetical protein G6F66_014422 [Rhizopus arrhizus]|nr:hypothetical protein G6F66_014422 [Rhizopus arrhizus]